MPVSHELIKRQGTSSQASSLIESPNTTSESKGSSPASPCARTVVQAVKKATKLARRHRREVRIVDFVKVRSLAVKFKPGSLSQQVYSKMREIERTAFDPSRPDA